MSLVNMVKGVFTLLEASTLNGTTYCNGRIYYGSAPLNTSGTSTTKTVAQFPYIVVNKISDEMQYTQQNATDYSKSIEDRLLLQIDIYDNNTSAINLETMAELLRMLFNMMRDPFAITGYVNPRIKNFYGGTIKTLDNNWRYISRYELIAQRS
jgi:hypothetical protein